MPYTEAYICKHVRRMLFIIALETNISCFITNLAVLNALLEYKTALLVFKKDQS